MILEHKNCKICNGTGKLKAGQLAINSSGKTVRTSDKLEDCKECGGKGFFLKLIKEES